MKTSLRFVSPLLLIITAASIPLLGCRRIATDALDRATEAAFAEASDGGMDTRIGHLPADFPKTAPLDPKADVVASCRLTVDAGENAWMAAFQTDESSAQVLAFYDSHLHRIEGDAGPSLSDFAARMTAQGLPSTATGMQLSESTSDLTQATTPFEYGSQGMLLLKTFQRNGATLKPSEKKTFFTLVIVNNGRPKI